MNNLLQYELTENIIDIEKERTLLDNQHRKKIMIYEVRPKIEGVFERIAN